MKTKRSYGTVDVEKFDAKAVLPVLATGCIVAIDVAKTKFVAAIATSSGDAVKLVKFEHPRQTGRFLEQLSILTEGGQKPRRRPWQESRLRNISAPARWDSCVPWSFEFKE